MKNKYRVTNQNGEEVGIKYFEEVRTFLIDEGNNLLLDFFSVDDHCLIVKGEWNKILAGKNGMTILTRDNVAITIGKCSNVKAGENCAVDASIYCHIEVCRDCNISAGDVSQIITENDCIIQCGKKCVVRCRNNCMISCGPRSSIYCGENCSIKGGENTTIQQNGDNCNILID